MRFFVIEANVTSACAQIHLHNKNQHAETELHGLLKLAVIFLKQQKRGMYHEILDDLTGDGRLWFKRM